MIRCAFASLALSQSHAQSVCLQRLRDLVSLAAGVFFAIWLALFVQRHGDQSGLNATVGHMHCICCLLWLRLQVMLLSLCTVKAHCFAV